MQDCKLSAMLLEGQVESGKWGLPRVVEACDFL